MFKIARASMRFSEIPGIDLPVFIVFTAASSVAQSPMCLGPAGASLQHVSEIICSAGGASAFLGRLILNRRAESSVAISRSTNSKV